MVNRVDSFRPVIRGAVDACGLFVYQDAACRQVGKMSLVKPSAKLHTPAAARKAAFSERARACSYSGTRTTARQCRTVEHRDSE
jgi:hypothetical protein